MMIAYKDGKVVMFSCLRVKAIDPFRRVLVAELKVIKSKDKLSQTR
jgi:hypothetical protein